MSIILEDVTPPDPPRIVRWVCTEGDCESWAEGPEESVTFVATQHALDHSQEGAPSAPAPEPEITPVALDPESWENEPSQSDDRSEP